MHAISRMFYTGWQLLRLIAVVASSIATILSSMLPLFLANKLSLDHFFLALIFFSVGALFVHGILTHLMNDYVDDLSGTDTHSPAILSGGSRVIQKGLMRPEVVWLLGKWLAIILLIVAGIFAVIGTYELTILIVVGVWGATSYSLPALRLSYYPFLGEWLSLFPAMFFLGIAAPWIILESIPPWAIQNSLINALFCMGWVMVHHIPDLEADKRAVPMKRTSAVWATEKFGLKYAPFPAFLYIFIAGICLGWVSIDRPMAALYAGLLIIVALILIGRMDPMNLKQVTNYEKILLLLAVCIAMILGTF